MHPQIADAERLILNMYHFKRADARRKMLGLKVASVSRGVTLGTN
jgi:hypothetical protein